MMNQAWFEMKDIRNHKFSTSGWIPLRFCNKFESKIKFGSIGYKEGFIGAGSLAVKNNKIDKIAEIGWSDIGINTYHSTYVDGKRYVPSDIFEYPRKKPIGIPLVLDQQLPIDERSIWHLHQDLVIALGLLREDDIWVCPKEGYCEVVRLKKDKNGRPILIEINTEFLLDYLCARKMGLLICSFFSRREIVDCIDHIKWEKNQLIEKSKNYYWEGRIREINEGGMPYDNTTKKLFDLIGECWISEWIGPGKNSSRVRNDDTPSSVYFITDSKGTLKNKMALISSGQYLWFNPMVIPRILKMRGGKLVWISQETGGIECSPERMVHFGINSVGLLNVLAKDITELPEWQKRIWGGYTIKPEGEVSDELFNVQMQLKTPITQAPEIRFGEMLHSLNENFSALYGKPLLLQNAFHGAIIKEIHRFRADSTNGFLGLAKDINRMISDSFDKSILLKIVPLEENAKLGSLKLLQSVLETMVTKKEAYSLMTPLFGIYDLRQMDAHPPGSESEFFDALRKIGIDTFEKGILPGMKLIENCSKALADINAVIHRTITSKNASSVTH